jgi:hypothetical protein
MTQHFIKKIIGTHVNPESEVYPLTVTLCSGASTIIAHISRATGECRNKIITHVQESVISYEDTLLYAEEFGELPCECVCEEIYMLGFDTWLKLNNL